MLACLWGVVDQASFTGTFRKFSGNGGYAFAIGLRVVLAYVAWMAAPQSLLPVFLQIVAVLSLAAALALLFMGIARFRKIVEWASSLSQGLMRDLARLWYGIWRRDDLGDRNSIEDLIVGAIANTSLSPTAGGISLDFSPALSAGSV